MVMSHYISLLFMCMGIVSVHGGFKTHYMTEQCNEDLGQRAGGRLESSTALTYDNLMDCYTSLSVPSGKHVFMTFYRFDIEEELNGACVDYLTVHDGSDTSAPALIDTWCDTIQDTFNVTSTGRHVTFYFQSDATARLRGFDVVYVAYSDPPCDSDEFRCASDICIDKSYQCDDIDQCGDESDEKECSGQDNDNDSNALPLDIIIGSAVGGTVFLIIVAIATYKLYWYWYWKTWMKRNAWKKFPWEDNDNHGYAYPKTDKYQIHDIGKKGRRAPDIAPYFMEQKQYEATLKADDCKRYLDEM